MTPTQNDPDTAQARVFRDLLHEEIAALTSRIETARGHIDRGGTEDRELGARLHTQLAEAHQLVARLTARYPELRSTGRLAGQ
ncbi:MAG: hypothetical protein WAW17_06030 [Rhodococcus sp. (in: high G+C Gram-positive bacteria)]|uniref:hypothetical protein n=1 Tax=Rhodococcus sp. TaxID=1831 RepID=UPI003BB0154A